MPRRPSIIPKETPEGVRVSIPATLSNDGKRHRKFFRTISEAKKFAASLRNQYDSGFRNRAISANLAADAAIAVELLAPTGLSLLEAVRVVVKQLSQTGGSETFEERYHRAVANGSTRWSKRYRQDMDRLLRWLPKKFLSLPCGTIDRAVVEAALVQDRPLARSTIDARATRVLAVLHYRERHRKSSEIKILTLAEVESVLGNCQSPEERRVVALLAFAGIRPDAESGEIARLDWEAVGAKEIYIAPATSKTGSDRHIEITPRLRAEIAGHPASGPVLPANWRRVWKRIRKAAGIAGEQDILRHSFASHYLAATDEAKAKAAMGHTAGSSTLFRHYRRAVTQADGLAYFGLCHDKKKRTKSG
jgi:integrase